MTTYTAIANSQIDADSYIDTVLAAQWRNNLLAIQEGDASASGVRIQNAALAGHPWTSSDYTASSVDQAAIGANAVGQSELKDALQQASASKGAGTNEYILFTGGVYTLGWGLANINFSVKGYNAAAYTAGIGIINNDSGSQTYYFQARYFTATKPYNLGYGEIPLFIFVIIDNATKNIEGISCADDAPWHYNGPTSIKADYYLNGDGYRYMQLIEQELIQQGKFLKDEIRGPQRDIILNRLATDIPEPVLIDQTIKNADMPLISNPFIGNDLTGKTVAAINPQNPIMEELLLLRNASESINDLFMDGNLIIDNIPIDRGFALSAYDLKWKLT